MWRPGVNAGLEWFPAGKGKGNPLFRQLTFPIWQTGASLIQYPDAYMHLPEKYHR